jgi:hypothetical protein
MRIAVLAVFLAATAIPACAQEAPAPPSALTLVLRPVAASALEGCDAAELDKALAEGLAKSDRFQLAPAPKDGAIAVEVLKCSRPQPKAVILYVRLAGRTSMEIISRGPDPTLADAVRRLQGAIESALEINATTLAGGSAASPAVR